MPTKSEASQHLARQIINVIAYVAMLVIGVTACTIPYNNNYLMDVVSRYNPDFMASAYVWYIFHIVSLVFLLWFVVYQAMSKRKHDKGLRALDIPFWIYVLGNIVWTFAFFYDVQWLALIAVLVAAAAVYYIFVQHGVGKDKVSNGHYWAVHFVFSLLAAAMLFAVVSQIAMFCVRYNLMWWGVGQTAWAVIAMLIIGFVGTVFMHYRYDVGFGCTMVWFSIGVAVYQNNYDPIVTAVAYLLALYFAVVTFACAMHRPRAVKKISK